MRAAFTGTLLAIVVAFAPFSDALAAPDAQKVRIAAERFDSGVSALKAKDYAQAASDFEAADDAVPGARTLKLAIRARSEAGHGSRAATLAALAHTRHASDADVTAAADEAIEKFGPKLYKLGVSCASPCVLAVGTRAIHGEATTRWTLYLDPGETTVSASFLGGVNAGSQTVNATVGGSSDVRFEIEGNDKPKTPPKGPADAPADPPGDLVDPDDNKGTMPPEDESWEGPFPIWVFVGGLVATAGVGGATIWSGVDTQENPGPDAVRRACAGEGESCPEYQDGLERQTRTNILIGVTAGVGALTVLAAILTDWDGDDETAKASANAKGVRGLRPGLFVAPAMNALSAPDAVLTLEGRF